MSRCTICGGASTCPEGIHKEVRKLPEGLYKFIKRDDPVPDGWFAVHWKKDGKYILPKTWKNYDVILCGSAQRHRVYAHYGVMPEWVGQCTYAYLAR